MELIFGIVAAAIAYWLFKAVLPVRIVGEAIKSHAIADADTQELNSICTDAIAQGLTFEEYKIVINELITEQAEREYGPFKQLVTRDAIIDRFINDRVRWCLAHWDEVYDGSHSG